MDNGAGGWRTSSTRYQLQLLVESRVDETTERRDEFLIPTIRRYGIRYPGFMRSYADGIDGL